MVSCVSAAIHLTPDTIQINASHDSSSTFTFQIENTFMVINATDNETLIDLEVSAQSDFSDGTNTIESGNLSIGILPTQIAPDTTSSDIIVTLNIPKSTPEGIYTGTFSIDGEKDTSPTSPNADTFTIILNVSESREISVSSNTMLENENSTTITITNEGNTPLSNIQLTTEDGDFSVEITGSNVNSSDSITSLAAGVTSDPITITRTSDLNDIGTQSVTIRATADDNTTATGEVSTLVSFCEDCENHGNLQIDIIDLTVTQGFGDSEDYWYPFDVIEAEIEIENDGNYDIEDVELSWALYTTAGKKITDDTESDFNLDENDDKILTITFALDEDVDDMVDEDLILYVKAEGKIDDNDKGIYDNEQTCAEDSEEVELVSDDTFVVLNDIEINGMAIKDLELTDSVACGTELQIIADVWNIGDEDQDDVTVLIYNNELGISKEVEIGNIDSFESEKLETTITIPEDAEAKYYTFNFMIYDEDNDLFETDEEEDNSIFKVMVNVDGNCKMKESAKITANLISEAQAGKQVTVETTITNTEDKIVTYVINVKDYEEWATLEDLESNTITLVAGESRDITLTFNVNKGVEGNKIFNIETISDSEIITTQPVSVSIEPQNVFGFLPGNNLYLWGIGALNVLLILSIIVVAIRLSKE